jgi:hypothetical protein
MLSTKMVELIESNWEEIADRMIRSVKRHPELTHLAKKPDLELREWCREMLQDLGDLISANDHEIQLRFEALGKARFEEDVPLHEAVLRIHLLKDKVIGFIHEQGFPMSAMQLYAEEELEHRLSRLFDAAVYRVVRGYENALEINSRLTRYA